MKTIERDVRQLTASSLYEYRVQTGGQPVIGEGDLGARVVFVGEAPGRREAETGRPFCGASGRVLDAWLESIALDRSSVYITNIVKDRPPENRDPTPDEIALYGPLLDRQLDAIQPTVIATLGRHSLGYVFNRFGLEDQITTISLMHGAPYTAQASWGPVVLFPLYHPAVALYQRSRAEELLLDIKRLQTCLT